MSSEEEETLHDEDQVENPIEESNESDDKYLEEDEMDNDDQEEDQLVDSAAEEESGERLPTKKRRKILKKSEFIDDEAELSGDDEVSEDEAENSEDDDIDLDLVDKDAPELDSDEEEAIRGLYHKQLATEDRRAVLLLQEQLEDNAVDLGQSRRKKFTWQTRELMEGNLLKQHFDPNDDASQDCDDSDDDDMPDIQLRLRRPSVDALIFGSRHQSSDKEPRAGTSRALYSDDSNSNTMTHEQLVASRMGLAATMTNTTTTTTTDMNRFLFRDKELVQALSTKETIITSREDKDRVIQRELKRVLQSKSIFDQLYS